MYLLAVVLPPVAVLACGKPGQAVLNLALTLFCAWIPGIIHAVMVVAEHKANERNADLIRAVRGSRGGGRGRGRERGDDPQPGGPKNPFADESPPDDQSNPFDFR